MKLNLSVHKRKVRDAVYIEIHEGSNVIYSKFYFSDLFAYIGFKLAVRKIKKYVGMSIELGLANKQ